MTTTPITAITGIAGTTIRGITVVDQAGNPLSNAGVTFVPDFGGGFYTVSEDLANGGFEFLLNTAVSGRVTVHHAPSGKMVTVPFTITTSIESISLVQTLA